LITSVDPAPNRRLALTSLYLPRDRLRLLFVCCYSHSAAAGFRVFVPFERFCELKVASLGGRIVSTLRQTIHHLTARHDLLDPVCCTSSAVLRLAGSGGVRGTTFPMFTFASAEWFTWVATRRRLFGSLVIDHGSVSLRPSVRRSSGSTLCQR